MQNGLFQWDAFQYRQTIERGYYLGQDYDTTAPYFPAFPLLAWALGKLVGSPLLGGILLNHGASIAAAFGMARLCRRLDVGEPAVRGPVMQREVTLFWLASPLTIFFCVFLSESLFGLLSVLVLWSVVAGVWPLVFLSGALITATRNAGMIVVFSAALLAWERRKLVRVGALGWLALALTPIGLAAFSIYQHYKVGDALAWVHVQIRWNRFLTTPWRTIKDDWEGLPGLGARNFRGMYKVQELLALGLTAPLFFLRGKLNIPWAILLLGVAEWLLPMLSHIADVVRALSGRQHLLRAGHPGATGRASHAARAVLDVLRDGARPVCVDVSIWRLGVVSRVSTFSKVSARALHVPFGYARQRPRYPPNGRCPGGAAGDLLPIALARTR